MTDIRAAKIAGIAKDIPLQAVSAGNENGRLAVVGWGSTYGPIHKAVQRLRAEGYDISQIHIRYLNPFPRNLGELLREFDDILVPEMNNGQLVTMLRSTYVIDAHGLNKVEGKPFKISELVSAFRSSLEN